MNKSFKLLLIIFIGISFSISGYTQDAKLSESKIKVDFRCINGKTRLENHFVDIKGIDNYKVEFDSKTMIFKYHPDIITKEQIIKEIEKVGYYTEFSDRSKVLKPNCKRR